jgi:hypothetical protein
LCVFEPSLVSLRQRRPYREGDHDIVGVLGCAVMVISNCLQIPKCGEACAHIWDRPDEPVSCFMTFINLSVIVTVEI